MPDLLDIVAEFRAAMLRQDEAAVKRLVEVYGRSWKRLEALVNALAEKIGNEAPTRGQVTRMMQYKSLQAQIEEELTGLQAITRDMVSEQGALNVAAGERDAARLVGATLTGDARILPGYNRLHPEAIVNMLGFLDPQGPLYKRISQLAPTTTDYVIEKLLEGVSLGYNPTKTARAIRDAYGRGLTDSLRMVRTVQLYSYREANRASYIANSDVVKGWQWGAKLDGLTCMSCVAQHGTIHPLTESLNDHHAGRCAMIPVTSLFPPALDEEGKAWFERQPEAMQRKMMGNGKYEAWKEGKFSLSDLSVQRKDSVYGQMRGVPPLKDLVGENNRFIQGLDLSKVSSYDDVTELFDGLTKKQYSIEQHGVVIDGDGFAKYRGVEIYFSDNSRKQAEELSVSLEMFRRNHGDAAFDKLYGDTRIAFTGNPSRYNAAATGGGGRITIYNNRRLNYEELIHEAGHTAGNKDYIVNALRKFIDEGELSPTGYGRVNIDEDIAETIRIYFTDIDKLRMQYDKRFRLMRDFFNG